MSAVAQGISRLDAMVHRFPNRVTQDIDLSGYMDDEQVHRVKSAMDFAEEVATLFFLPPDQQGRQLPWAGFGNKFYFRQNELTIWTGFKGHGKSAALSQVMNFSMCQGDKVFIISPEFKPARVIERMIMQKVGRRDVSEYQLAEWFNWAENLLWLYDCQSSLKQQDVLALCRYAIDKFQVDHIVIDSLMKMGINPDDYGNQKQFVDRIQSIAHNNPVHIHLVAHARKGSSDEVPPRLHDIKGTSEIADMAENVFVVWRNKPKEKAVSMGDRKKDEEPDAIAFVEAQRNGDGWIGGVPLEFDPHSMLFKGEADRCPI